MNGMFLKEFPYLLGRIDVVSGVTDDEFGHGSTPGP